MTKATMEAALTKAGLDPSKFKPWFTDWTGVDNRIFEVTVADGIWRERDYNDGVIDGGGERPFTLANESTLVVHDKENACDIPFILNRSGEDLVVKVGDDTCGADDVMLETAIYEATPFHLIQTADWQPPTWSRPPSPSPSPSLAVSTSSERQTPRPVGSVDGAPLGYLEYLPPSYSETGDKSPLILFLHGSGGSGNGGPTAVNIVAGAGIPGLIATNNWPDARPFVVLSPQHDDSNPPSRCMESNEIDDFLHFALGHYNVDPSRLYVTGVSCGAIGLWNYLNDHGDELIAAAVPIAGNGLLAIDQHGCDLGATPIWALHGALDDTVPIETEAYPLTQLQQCTDPAPVDARLTVYPNSGHDVWTTTYAGGAGDIYSWMLSHHR